MCQYHTCYNDNKKGYVVQCKECRRLQLGYGNIMVNFHTGEFESFRSLVKDLYSKQSSVEPTQVKSIVIPTPCDCVTLLLSQEDLADLHGMLEAADNEIQAQALMGMFNQ